MLEFFLFSKKPEQLVGKRIAMFSYGSGLASSLYSFNVSSDVAAVAKLTTSVSHLPKMLESRTKVPPAEFAKMMKLREETHHLAPYKPVADIDLLYPGAYYLASVDDKHRRQYERKAGGTSRLENGQD